MAVSRNNSELLNYNQNNHSVQSINDAQQPQEKTTPYRVEMMLTTLTRAKRGTLQKWNDSYAGVPCRVNKER